MKKIFVLLLCFLVQQAWAVNPEKTSLSGKITDKNTHAALPGVEVYFPDLKTGTATKADGTYFIDNLPGITVLVTVRMTGYAAISEQVDLSVVTQKNFELEPSITELKTYVVTGTSHATELRRNPVPIVIADQQYLSQNLSTNLVGSMAKIPGVSALNTGPNIAKPYIRGLGYNRVLTLYDGVRQDGQQWGDEHGIEIDQFLVDRIEVVKGPASLIYGSDAMAGVVNFIPADPVAPGTVKGSVLLNYLTNNNQLAGSVALNGNVNGFTWGFRASHKQASDFRNRIDGRVYGTKYNETDLNFNAGVNRSWGYSYLNFSAYDNLQEVPDGSRDSLTRKFTKQITEADSVRPIVTEDELNSYTIGTIHQRVQHFRVYSANNFLIGNYRLSVRIGAQQSIRQEFSHPENPGLAGLHLVMNTYSYDVKFFIPEGKWPLETTVGVNGMYQKNDNREATEFVIPDYHSLDAGPFVFMKRTIGKLDIAFGARNDLRWFENDSLFTHSDPQTGFDTETAFSANDTTLTKQFDYYRHTFSGFSASAGATYNFTNELGLKMNVSRGYRAPNVAEISAKGVHPGTGFEQLGEANLLPEFSLQEDLGIFLSKDHISASLELFNNSISNYIYNEKLQSVNGGDSLFVQGSEAFPVFKFRQTRAQLYGGELSFDLHPHPLDWLHFENSLSVLYAVNRGGNGAVISDSTKYLPFIPPLHTNTELRADLKKTGKYFANVYLKAGFQYYAAQNRAFLAYGTETVTPGYFLLDAGFGADIVNAKGIPLFTITVSGENLTDEAYQSNMSRMKYMDNYPVNGTGRSGIYSMGRNFSVRILVPLNLKQPKSEETVVPVKG
jgi:iron complex outermembrane receptor protein